MTDAVTPGMFPPAGTMDDPGRTEQRALFGAAEGRTAPPDPLACAGCGTDCAAAGTHRDGVTLCPRCVSLGAEPLTLTD
ncbi:MAG: hypothetical protein GY795_24540 [Desulfobacterales bacterium]|nr:hypothetical protein [Desulfobacterales bacterium]